MQHALVAFCKTHPKHCQAQGRLLGMFCMTSFIWGFPISHVLQMQMHWESYCQWMHQQNIAKWFTVWFCFWYSVVFECNKYATRLVRTAPRCFNSPVLISPASVVQKHLHELMKPAWMRGRLPSQTTRTARLWSFNILRFNWPAFIRIFTGMLWYSSRFEAKGLSVLVIVSLMVWSTGIGPTELWLQIWMQNLLCKQESRTG